MPCKLTHISKSRCCTGIKWHNIFFVIKLMMENENFSYYSAGHIPKSPMLVVECKQQWTSMPSGTFAPQGAHSKEMK